MRRGWPNRHSIVLGQTLHLIYGLPGKAISVLLRTSNGQGKQETNSNRNINEPHAGDLKC